MLTRKAVLIGLTVLASTWTRALPARACTCPPYGNSIAQEFEASAAVFHGVVLDHEVVWMYGWWSRRIYFDVVESWKGVRSHHVCVATAPGSAECGLSATVGQELLVYAQGDSFTLWTHSCTRTGMMSDGALADITWLRAHGYEVLELDGAEFANFDGDATLDRFDLGEGVRCLTGPCGLHACEEMLYLDPCCAIADSDSDGDVDLRDVAAFQLAYSGN